MDFWESVYLRWDGALWVEAESELLSRVLILFPFLQTMEEEKDAQLPFLDVLVCRVKDNQFITSVYHKPTHTDRCINYNSHHHSGVFRGTIHCLRDRACNV